MKAYAVMFYGLRTPLNLTRRENVMLRLIAAVMAMLAFAPGALANTEAGSQCFAPSSTPSPPPRPRSTDVFLFVHDPACKDQIGYENCKWKADRDWMTCMGAARKPDMLLGPRSRRAYRCHRKGKFARDTCQIRYCR